MSILCRHIASEINKHIPGLSLGNGIIIGPPRPYETERDGREGAPPLTVFINESGGLRDVRTIGSRDTHLKTMVKIIIRSNKVNYLNEGGKGSFAEGLRLTKSIAQSVRMMDNEWVPDAILYAQPIYLGTHEDDMHYWSMNILTRSCANVGTIYYGEAASLEDYTTIDSGSALESLIYSGSYDVDGPLQFKYVLIPESMVQGLSFESYMLSDGEKVDLDPQEFSTEIDGQEYRAVWFTSGGLPNIEIVICDI